MLGEEEAGTEAGGFWATIVVRKDTASRDVDSVVGDSNCPGTDLKLLSVVGVRTVMSKRPPLRDLTWTVIGSADVSSVWRVMRRS